MDVIHGCGDADHWRSLFEASLELEDGSDMQSVSTPGRKNEPRAIMLSNDARMVGEPPGIPGNIPSTLEFEEGFNEDFDDTTLHDPHRLESGSLISDVNTLLFKIVDQEGHTHRLKSEARVLNLRNAFADKKNLGKAKANGICFKFFDEDGDAILISTDEDLAEAIRHARQSNPGQGNKLVVKLVAEFGKDGPIDVDPMVMTGIGVTVAAVAVGVLLMMMSKPVTPTRY